jgi:hypothetical protein
MFLSLEAPGLHSGGFFVDMLLVLAKNVQGDGGA